MQIIIIETQLSFLCSKSGQMYPMFQNSKGTFIEFFGSLNALYLIYIIVDVLELSPSRRELRSQTPTRRQSKTIEYMFSW